MKQDTQPRARTLLPSPLGTLQIEADDAGITAIRFLSPVPSHRAAPTLLPDPTLLPIPKNPHNPHTPALRVLRDAVEQLLAYLHGDLTRFELPLAPSGTPFQLEVWAALQEIPWGKTATYGDIARRVGRPRAARAVGAANRANPIPIIIPCHRVVGVRGDLVGYASGLDRKRWLLAHERNYRPAGETGNILEAGEGHREHPGNG